MPLPGGSVGKNVIFWADMNSSGHIDNKRKDILILGKGPTQGLNNTMLTAENQYSISFTLPNKRFVLRLHYTLSSSFLFVNVTKIFQLKVKNSEIKEYVFFLGNISKIFTADNMIKTGLKGVIIFFLLILNKLMLTIFQMSINI